MSGSTFDVAVTIPQEMVLSGNLTEKDVLKLAVPECLSKLADRTALLATSDITPASFKNELRDTGLRAIRQLTAQSSELGITPDQSVNGHYEMARRALDSNAQALEISGNLPLPQKDKPMDGHPLSATFHVTKDEIFAGRLDGKALLKRALNAAESQLAAHADLATSIGADSRPELLRVITAYQRLSAEGDHLRLPHNTKEDQQIETAQAAWTRSVTAGSREKPAQTSWAERTTTKATPNTTVSLP